MMFVSPLLRNLPIFCYFIVEAMTHSDKYKQSGIFAMKNIQFVNVDSDATWRVDTRETGSSRLFNVMGGCSSTPSSKRVPTPQYTL